MWRPFLSAVLVALLRQRRALVGCVVLIFRTLGRAVRDFRLPQAALTDGSDHGGVETRTRAPRGQAGLALELV
jgi:hypothetical protein